MALKQFTISLLVLSMALPAVAQTRRVSPSTSKSSKIKSAVRISAAATKADYNESSWSQRTDQAGKREDVALDGYDAQLAASVGDFETEIGSRTLTPRDLPSWTQLRELTLVESWYAPQFPWLRPAFGAFLTTQAGDQNAEGAQPAFVARNRGLILGLHTSFVPLDWGWHGSWADARLDYLTSLEKRRNFGTHMSARLGYFLAFGDLRFAVFGRFERQFFNATQVDPQDTAYVLKVRHTYEAQSLGLQIDY